MNNKNNKLEKIADQAFIFFDTFLIFIWVVIGTTESFLLWINITSEPLFILFFDAKNSVTPIFFDLFNNFLSIGQLINPLTFLFWANLWAKLKESVIYFVEFYTQPTSNTNTRLTRFGLLSLHLNAFWCMYQ